MPYKDPEKQREANRLRMQKARQGNTEGNTEQGSTNRNVLPSVEPKSRTLVMHDGQVHDPASVIQGDYKRYPLRSGRCMWCGAAIPKTDNCCKPCFPFNQ